jgi:hypothetical protein
MLCHINPEIRSFKIHLPCSDSKKVLNTQKKIIKGKVVPVFQLNTTP